MGPQWPEGFYLRAQKLVERLRRITWDGLILVEGIIETIGIPVISWDWSIKGWYFRIDIQGHDLHTAGRVDVADGGGP